MPAAAIISKAGRSIHYLF